MPVMPTFDAYQVLPNTSLNLIAREVERVARGLFGLVDNVARPTVTAYLTNPITMANEVNVPIAFQTATPDPDGMFDVANPSLLTVRTPGLWQWFSQSAWVPHEGGACTARIVIANTGEVTMASGTIPSHSNGEGPKINLAGRPTLMTANQQVYLNEWQNSGVGQASAMTYGGTWLSGVWLGPTPS